MNVCIMLGEIEISCLKHLLNIMAIFYICLTHMDIINHVNVESVGMFTLKESPSIISTNSTPYFLGIFLNKGVTMYYSFFFLIFY